MSCRPTPARRFAGSLGALCTGVYYCYSVRVGGRPAVNGNSLQCDLFHCAAERRRCRRRALGHEGSVRPEPRRQGGPLLLKAFAVRHLPHPCRLALQKRRRCRGWVRGPLSLGCWPHRSRAAGCTGEHADGESDVSSGSAPTLQLHQPLHSPRRATGKEQAGTEMGSCSFQGHSKPGPGETSHPQVCSLGSKSRSWRRLYLPI